MSESVNQAYQEAGSFCYITLPFLGLIIAVCAVCCTFAAWNLANNYAKVHADTLKQANKAQAIERINRADP